MLDDYALKGMDGDFKSIKPLTAAEKKPKVEFEGQAAVESQQTTARKEVTTPKPANSKAVDLSVEVQKALPLMNDSGNWQKRKDGA